MRRSVPDGVGIGHRDGGHVDDAPHRGAGGEDVHRLGCAQQNGANGHIVAGCRLEQVLGDIGGIHIGHDQQIGAARERAVWHEFSALTGIQRHVAVHFAIHF